MPEPIKSLNNLKGHWTKAQLATRQAAEGGLKRKGRPQLRCPKWLAGDARSIFQETKKRLKGLELLDNVDVELLAIYSDAVAKYRDASSLISRGDAVDEDIKAAQTWLLRVLAISEKLGLTPTARARLAKRKSEQPQKDEMEMLLDDVVDYVNGEQDV